ncbi:hypothetical protein [Cytobacillus purgationiresistens]|uniref:Uncharacterized protein n=1 Tax=Cytobacillus purgationiresistens TaxID=863449 RepID=A0ABU0AFA3_9BACI|nr:hypothetical protein [Cytobacillus purgationiresistens]MDQ0269539.1 hypothetical protein [Cytobacillus purgationiresistens]
MTANRIILGFVFFIITLITLAEIVFNDFTIKPILLFLASLVIIAFLWKRDDNKT